VIDVWKILLLVLDFNCYSLVDQFPGSCHAMNRTPCFYGERKRERERERVREQERERESNADLFNFLSTKKQPAS